ncbi:hypothetical protein D3C81_865840 [compost metagenome]
MEQEVLFVLTGDGIDDLAITGGAQGDGHDGLRFTAGEQRGTVGTRQDAGLHCDRADGVQRTAVDADLGVQHRVAHGAVFQLAEFLRHFSRVPAFSGNAASQGFNRVLLDRRDGVTTLQLVTHLEGFAELAADGFLQCADQRGVLGRSNPVARLGAGFNRHLVDDVDDLLHFAVTEGHGAQHHFFGQQRGFGFHHQHGIGGTSDHQLQLRFLQLRHGRVEDVFAVLVTHLRSSDRALERGTGQRQCSRCTDQRGDVAVHVRVHRHHRGDDLDFVLVVFREQRTDRTIDQTRDQRLLLGRTAFALEEATRDTATGVEPLLIINGQREEVLAFARALGGDGSDQQHGVVHLDDDSAAGLTGDFAGFKRDGVFAVLEGFGDFCHGSSLECFLQMDRCRPMPLPGGRAVPAALNYNFETVKTKPRRIAAPRRGIY